MWNKIAERLHPFSHLPGTFCCIPNSQWQVQVFPALLRFKKGSEEREFPIVMRGPMREFTVELDLEKGVVRIFGKAQDGYLRYLILKEEKGIAIQFEKSFSSDHKSRLLIEEESVFALPPQERLSLGMHRKQDWDLVSRRGDLAEILPILYRLADWLPALPMEKKRAGTLRLLDHCRDLIEKREKTQILPSFLNFFEAGFHGILAPRLFDDQFQGFLPVEEKIPSGLSSLALISESRALIRSLFITEEGDEASLLPCLPPEFHSGRILNTQLQAGHQIDLEWSKKQLQRVMIRPAASRSLSLILHKPLKSCRLRQSLHERGETLSSGDPIPLIEGVTLHLDRFQK